MCVCTVIYSIVIITGLAFTNRCQDCYIFARLKVSYLCIILWCKVFITHHIIQHGLALVEALPYLPTGRYLGCSVFELFMHSYLIGTSGMCRLALY